MRNIKENIEICTQFAVRHGLCAPADAPLVRNRLLSLFRLDAPFEGDIDLPDSLVPVLEEMVDYAAEASLLEMNTPTYRAMLDNTICACLLMMPSQTEEKFFSLYRQSPQKATDWFYTLCRDVNYIRTFDVAKNILFDYNSAYSKMEITINLTKPEKDPREIEKQKIMPQTNYPKCMLCLENVGYPGRLGYPSHETLRVIPITLDGERWYFQYSPYVYYNEHCIVFCEKHTPMTMDRRKFVRLFEFLHLFPHYFIGSNTQLPVVGGSILAHEHFQGGRHDMPMALAKPKYTFSVGDPLVKAQVVDWPMTCLRLTGKDDQKIIPIAARILETWQNYDDPAMTIYSHTDREHNTITPIVRINGAGEYECDIVLRNSLTTEELPLGVFHPHPDKHNIKKENIGLIEVMGMFILPGRLKTELETVAQCWFHNSDLPDDSVHRAWYESFRYARRPKSLEEAKEELKTLVGGVCENVLRDASVFKDDDAGQAGLKRFLRACGFEV
ncbi:MAG: UDP-glucose--hexose-1-phosphate uridylyltransferase [Clostridia bacterium]|nr:UDP-glucose--hexose-1-phosphate uridylyltransferase [Clostridia bacterium]